MIPRMKNQLFTPLVKKITKDGLDIMQIRREDSVKISKRRLKRGLKTAKETMPTLPSPRWLLKTVHFDQPNGVVQTRWENILITVADFDQSASLCA